MKSSTGVRHAQPVGGQKAHRVLLVEDHAPLAEATAEFMRSAGLEVRIASSGQDALTEAAAFQPEIVLCDMRLQDMSGLAVARALRTIPGASRALIAMHSAMTETDLPMLERIDAPEVNLFLTKPLTETKLETLISRLHAFQRAARRSK